MDVVARPVGVRLAVVRLYANPRNSRPSLVVTATSSTTGLGGTKPATRRIGVPIRVATRSRRRLSSGWGRRRDSGIGFKRGDATLKLSNDSRYDIHYVCSRKVGRRLFTRCRVAFIVGNAILDCLDRCRHLSIANILDAAPSFALRCAIIEHTLASLTEVVDLITRCAGLLSFFFGCHLTAPTRTGGQRYTGFFP